jgi:glycosyltransferase involved in cell wall biosynthesis
VPLVVTLHLGRFGGGGPLALALRAYEETVGRLVLRRANAVIAVSHAVGRLAQRLAPAQTPVTVIPNTADVARFSPAAFKRSDPVRVLFVGRLVHNKGPAVFLLAAKLALEQEPGMRFVLAGSGPLEGRLKSLARKLRIEGSVDFLGHRADIPDLLRASTVLVRPSDLEGMPLTVLEAMASGIPVVATDVGGTPELVEDGVTGYLVRPGDPRAVAMAVLKIAGNPERAVSMGRAARQRMEQRPTQEMIVEMNEQVYFKALSR